MLPPKMLHKFRDNLIDGSFKPKAQARAQHTAAENELKLEEAAFSFFNEMNSFMTWPDHMLVGD